MTQKNPVMAAFPCDVSIGAFKPRLCSRIRGEAQKTLAKRAVGPILWRRHIHKYVEEQNRETSVTARIFKPQEEATAQSGLNRHLHE